VGKAVNVIGQSFRDKFRANRVCLLLHPQTQSSVSTTMLALTRTAGDAMRPLQRLAAGLATVAPRIGDTKVPMSLLEKDAYINYQRIEDNLAIIRER